MVIDSIEPAAPNRQACMERREHTNCGGVSDLYRLEGVEKVGVVTYCSSIDCDEFRPRRVERSAPFRIREHNSRPPYCSAGRLTGTPTNTPHSLVGPPSTGPFPTVAGSPYEWQEMFGDHRAIAAPSSPRWAGSAPASCAATNPADGLHRDGRGSIAYPGGTAAAADSMTQGSEAAPAAVPSTKHAGARDEQRQAMSTFVENR